MRCFFSGSWLLVAALCLSICLKAQVTKPAVDTDAENHWPTVDRGGISPNGQYAWYVVYERFRYNITNETLVIRKRDGAWQRTFDTRWVNPQYSPDSRRLLFMLKDTLVIVTMGGQGEERIPGVVDLSLDGDVLLYRVGGVAGGMHLRSLSTGKERSIENVNRSFYHAASKTLVIQQPLNADTVQLSWLTPGRTGLTPLWRGAAIQSMIFDAAGRQIAFSTGEGIKKKVLLYNKLSKQTTVLLDNNAQGLEKGFMLENVRSFTKDGRKLLLTVRQERTIPPVRDTDNAAHVLVWSYTDIRLPTSRPPEIMETFVAVTDVQEKRIVRLQEQGDELFGQTNGSVWVEHRGIGPMSENSWNRWSETCRQLVSFKDGSRVPVPDPVVQLSDEGRYELCFDQLTGQYYTKEISTGTERPLTPPTGVSWRSLSPDRMGKENGADTYDITWLSQDSAVVMSDGYDLWQLDPQGKSRPRNLTNGYGRKHATRFYLLPGRQSQQWKKGASVVLSAFNRRNKDNGYFEITIGRQADPKMLTMGPYVYYLPNNNLPDPGIPVQKAAHANIWLVKRMDASSTPNLYITRDFRKFDPLSDIHPERKYNWLTTQLHSFVTQRGDTVAGVLYKPENFDSSKRYPVIIYYYEKHSQNLHSFISPALSIGPINIPWFVSRGYLVFTPDIIYEIGHTGASALRSVEAAGRYLKGLPFVNGRKIGIQGHSFGGLETYYIVTHSSQFAAACAASGIADFIRGYGGMGDGGESLQKWYEEGQFRMGTTPWKDPDLFIDHSGLLRADKVSTPLLMMHTTLDQATTPDQALAFFTALRRIGRPSWLLMYDKVSHSLYEQPAVVDYTRRLEQFFDHYLKDAPAPVWMAGGVPASSGQ